MNPIVYYRDFDTIPDEQKAIKEFFPATESRMTVPTHSLVIPRFTALPFLRELSDDMKLIGSRLINSPLQFQYIADLRNWYEDLKEFTPRTWFTFTDVMNDESYNGPYVLKGATNSMKHKWNTHMYAPNKDALREVYFRLTDDGVVGTQNIYIRQYEHFQSAGVRLGEFVGRKDIAGFPITAEYRFFVAYGTVLTGAFYWSTHVDDILANGGHIQSPSEWPGMMEFVQQVVDRVGDNSNFYVIDIAVQPMISFDTTSDEDFVPRYRVVELNAGEMSGLSENDPHTLWKNFAAVLKLRNEVRRDG